MVVVGLWQTIILLIIFASFFVSYFFKCFREGLVQLDRLPLHENLDRLRDETPDAHGDQESDEDGADGIRDHPAEHLHQDRRDDDAHAAQRVGQDVQEDLDWCKTLFLMQ